MQLNIKKPNQSYQKCEDLNRQFSKEDTEMAKRHMKRYLISTNYQRNSTQNYNDVSPHTGENSHHLKSL